LGCAGCLVVVVCALVALLLLGAAVDAAFGALVGG
jgi:hypothetical protein